MAIRDLGESLLGKQRKARRKLERRAIIAGAVLPAIQSAIEQSADRKDRELLSTNHSAMEVAANFQIAGKNADELKKLDKQIVLNSMILKWNNIQKDFKKLASNFESN